MAALVLLIQDLYASFKNTPGGLSARKCTAFACVLVSAFVTYRHTTDANLPTVLFIWLGVGLLCLGIITMEQITTFKNGKHNTDKPGNA